VQTPQLEALAYYSASWIRAHISTEAVPLALRGWRINRKR
jgi:hypothetical protein